MMTLKLIKVFFKENLSFKRLLGFDARTSRLKAVLIVLAILYAVVSFFGLVGFMFFDLAELLGEAGMGGLVLSFLFTYFIGLTFLVVFLRSNGYLFYYRDFDILGSLPLSPRTLFTAKLSLLMVFVYLSAFILTLPIAFAYFHHVQFSLLGLLIYLASFLFLPLVPLILVTLVSLLIARVTSGFKRSKLINTVLLFLIFFGVAALSMSLSSVEGDNPLLAQQAFISNLERFYPPMLWFREAIHDSAVLPLIYLVGFNAFPFVAFIYLMPPFVHRLNQRGLKSRVQKSGKPVVSKSRPVIKTLISKEFRKLADVPMYALNAALGPVVLLLVPFAALFFRDTLQETLLSMNDMNLQIDMILGAFIAFSIVMSYSPAISLSLEGKKFWILRSLPLKAETILLSKVLFNMLLTVPLGILGLLILGMLFDATMIQMVLIMLFIVSFSASTSLLFSVLNLLMPKFDFSNEIEVIKQSASAFIAIFAGFTLIVGEGFVLFKLSGMMHTTLGWSVIIALNLALALGAYMFIRKKAEGIFRRYDI